MMIAKRKIESPRDHYPLTCMRIVWVSQRHRQLNGHSMDLEQCSERSMWLIIRTSWYCIGSLFEGALDTCRRCALWLYVLALSSPWKHSLLPAAAIVRVQEIAIFEWRIARCCKREAMLRDLSRNSCADKPTHYSHRWSNRIPTSERRCVWPAR